MHKKLMAVAIAGAFTAPAIALAQSTVQIYGNAEWEYGWIDQGSGRPNADYNEVTGSYLGFRGTEALGGGISAWFQCETTMDIRAFDQTGLCSRNSGLGFRGGFGNVWGGRWHTPYSRIFGLGSVGQEETGNLGVSWIMGGSGSTSLVDVTAGAGDTISGGQQRHRFRRRETCLTTYETPNFGGFMVGAAVSCGNAAVEGAATNNGNNQKPRLWSVAGTYINGPIAFGIGYERHNEVGAFNVPNAPELDDKSYGAAGSYSFGPFKVGLQYMKREWETATGDLDKSTWTISAQWNIAGPHTIMAFYGDTGDSKGSSLTGISTTSQGGAAAPGSDTGYQQFTLAYQYAFSKRTTAKIGYTRAENDSNSNQFWVGNSARPVQNGETTEGVSLVLKHRF